MLDLARHDDELALADVHVAVAQFHEQRALHDEEQLVLDVVVMPLERAAQLYQLDLHVVHVADDVRIEGPPGLRDHLAVVQDLEIHDYTEKTLPEGFLREARLKTDVGGFGIRAQLDNLTIAATKSLRILERPGEVPITIEARGDAVWTNAKTKAERRGDFLTIVGKRPR